MEMVLKKPNPGEKFDIKGKLIDQIKLTMVIDGYNAPITGATRHPLAMKGWTTTSRRRASDASRSSSMAEISCL